MTGERITPRDFLAYAHVEFRAGLACFILAFAALLAACVAAFDDRKAE